MPSREPHVRDDRILGYTRALAWFIAPFLIVAFVVLYPFPGQTHRLFAWTIKPTMTPMLLASAYLGGFYYFLRVPRERRWAAVKTGFLSVALFASLLAVATLLHWDKFNHRHVAFWLWAALYFAAPFLVIGAWVANNRVSLAPTAGEQRLSEPTRWIIGLTGTAALVTGVVMFLAPAQVIPIWPWLLTPLTCRVVGAIFCLGSAGLGVFVDPRWITVQLMLQVEMIMIGLILFAAVRARGEFFTDRPLTWLMLGGFIAVLTGSAYLWSTQTAREARAPGGNRGTQSTPTAPGRGSR
jgi:hypothetical protein